MDRPAISSLVGGNAHNSGRDHSFSGLTTMVSIAQQPSPDHMNGKHKATRPRHHTVVRFLVLVIVLSLFWRQQDLQYLNIQSSRETTNVNPIRQIAILGERNSGTRWTVDHISDCFNSSLVVTNRLTRHKHWFQYDEPSKYLHDALVLAQFRNPYEWLKAMERVPHHSPNHLRLAANASVDSRMSDNDWRIFLTKPWTMPRVGKDLKMRGDEMCQDNFRYKDIVSCALEPLPASHYKHKVRYSEHQPFYEMKNDGSGEPYANLLELRTDKIRNFLSLGERTGIADVWVLQYEYLLAHGTSDLIARLEEWTGETAQCAPKPPQQRRQKKTRVISPDFAAHVREHLNWTVEGWIGYGVEWNREQTAPEW